jgi:hypothetical protein
MSEQRSKIGSASRAVSFVDGPRSVGSGYRDYDRYSVRLGDAGDKSTAFEVDATASRMIDRKRPSLSAASETV